MSKTDRKPLLVELPKDFSQRFENYCAKEQKAKVHVVVDALKAHMNGGKASAENLAEEFDPTVAEMVAAYREAAISPDFAKLIEAALRWFIEYEVRTNDGLGKRYSEALARKKRVPNITEARKGGRE